MRRLRTILATGVILVAACASLYAEDARVKARLVADTSSVEPGSLFQLGVHFEIEDGWHIYWRNPGGAGLATAVDFDLPDGFSVGPLQWPLPISFDQSEGIPGYGYEGSVVLAVDVDTQEGVNPARTEMIRAQVSWLACKGVCVLGSAELETPLVALPRDAIFERWGEQLPEANAANAPFSTSSTGGVDEGTVTLWLRWDTDPRPVEWFPDPSDALEVGEVRIQTRGGLTRIDAEVKARKGASGRIDVLPSLFVVTGEDGTRHGWGITIGLTDES